MPKRLRKRASKATAIPLHNATQLIKKPVVRRKTKKERRKEKSLKFKQRIAKDIQKEKNVEDQTKISVASLVHSLKEADLRNQHEEQKEQQKKAQNNGRLRAKWQYVFIISLLRTIDTNKNKKGRRK
eukprot:TRINITY_DN1839_c0_g1_i1.p1 TRINITY_DN1839_c0_g1~~TRINITY_DN1839_c0_g1_i1.p1  ORF type:complete len:127 (+),score=30.64 TRINITY_DN1839_c0_g1_i1:75-455(+)